MIRLITRSQSRLVGSIVTNKVSCQSPSLNSSYSSVIYAHNEKVADMIGEKIVVFEDFISEVEEDSLISELHPILRKLRYESSHWDNAISLYRETEKSCWTDTNEQIIRRVRQFIFPEELDEKPLPLVHVLDLAADGEIRPHVDAVRFCGRIIGGLSLMSPSVMQLTYEKNGVKDPSLALDVLLKRRSLYVMTDEARFDFAHAIFGPKDSVFRGRHVDKSRRISIIFRCHPKDRVI